MSSKPNLKILWLDDNRNPNIYFTNPLNSSPAAERNRGFYNSNIFNKYTPHFIWVKNRSEFQNYIENHELPDFISFDHDIKKDPNFQEYDGRATARWLVEFCKLTNQPLPWCFVHSANHKRISELEDILGISHIPLPQKTNRQKKTKSPILNKKEHVFLDKCSMTKESQDNRHINHILIENIKALMMARGYTQSSLARELKKQSVQINRVLRGKQPISPKLQMDLANLFAVSIEDLNGTTEASPIAKDIRGFIRISKKEIKEFYSWKELKKCYKDLSYKLEERPKEVKLLIKECSDRTKKVKLIPRQWTDLDLYRFEKYDAETTCCWTFRKAEDERDEIPNSLGNMCKGYLVEINGLVFKSSEAAYIAGLFSDDTKECLFVQRKLVAEESGYSTKKKIRNVYESFCGRKDWETYNVQWMLFVVWQKCLQNESFRDLLLKTYQNSIIIENSAMQTGKTADFWGCKNEEWKEAYKMIDANAKFECSTESNYKAKLIKDSNAITQLGVYCGVNCMGKILTICRECLRNGKEPLIDYELLKSKKIYINGREVIF